MPYRVNNTFHPSSPFGAPIQGFTRALFGGATPAEEEAKLAAAEAHRAQGEHYRAQNAKLAAETAGLAEAQRRAQDPVANFVNNVFGAERGGEVTNFQRGVQVDSPMGRGMTGSLDEQDIPMGGKEAAPRPAWLSPKDEAALNEQARVIAIANNLTGKTSGSGYDDIGKTIRLGAAQDAVMAGTADATRTAQAFGATSGKMPFQQGQFGMGNELTGEIADPRLFNSAVALSGEKKNTEVAHQGAYKGQANASNAAAGASSAHAGLYKAQTEDVNTSKAMVPALDSTGGPILDAAGKPVMIQRRDLGQLLVKGDQARASQDNKDGNKDPKAGQDKPPISIKRKDVLDEIDRLTDAGPKRKLDPAFANAVAARAIELAQTKGGKFWNNSAAAVAAALDEATGGRELEDITDSYLQGNKRFAAPGFKPGAAPNTNARPTGATGPVRITGDADYAKLPSGTQYTAPDGSVRVKK